MTPAARVQTAIEIIDAIVAAARDGGAPADVVFADAMRARRYAGSKDRRAVRDHVYAAIRSARALPVSGRAAMLTLADGDAALGALFDGHAYGPAVIAPGEPRAPAGLASAALIARFDPLIDASEHSAMQGRAPLDLRANVSRGPRDALASLFPDAHAVVGLAHALRLPPEAPAVQHPAFAEGLFEVQDAASQFAALAVGAGPDAIVIDLCAGAGGKTLAIAASADASARIIACDITRSRLQQLGPRAERAGAKGIETRLLNPGQELAALADVAGRATCVLVDAPCSGSGTWRRSPELRWRLTPKRLARHVAEQAKLLDIAAALVAPDGALVYATCSVLVDEGRDQITQFLKRHSGWVADHDILPPEIGRAAGDGWLMTPAHDATDGFFLARLRRA